MAALNLIGSYNYPLVALSVLIAMFASYTALDLAGRVTAAGGWTRAVWLLGGAGAMGTGIWSMHYIGMLAFVLPIPVAYHWPTVLLSLFAAILASVVALDVVSRQKMGWFRALAGSVLMGAGIASMHYIGMAAMRLPALCQFNSFLVVLSVVFAVLISLAALWITFHLRDEKTGIGWEKLAGAVVMGGAIPVMHYTGMAAASFTAFDMPTDLSHAVSVSTLGTGGIAAVTFIALGLALVTSWVDRRFAIQTLEVQEEKLQQSEAYLSEAQRLSHTGSFGCKVSTGDVIWSEESFRIFQYDRTTKPTLELILQRVHPEDTALVRQTIERAAQDGKDFDLEHRLLMPDSSVKHVHIVAHAKKDASGELEFVGAVMDVTSAKQAEEALRRSESYLAEAQKLTHTGSWAWRVEGRDAVHLSEEWYRINGFDPEKGILAWEERLQRLYPGDRAKWQEATERAIAEKSDYEVEVRILLPDGTVKDIRTVGHPVLNASGELVQFVGSSTDITERKRTGVLLAGEKRLLEMIARGDSRTVILDALCRLVEELASGSLSSILLLDPIANCLRHGAAPSLPRSYTEAIDGAVIGPSAGSCGTAAYRAEPVIVSDIATDPLWADYRDLALTHGLRACWSTPILSSARKVLGTFAIYYREPRSPTAEDHSVIKQIIHLGSIAIERQQAEDALRRSEGYLAEAQRLARIGSWAWNVATRRSVYWSRENYRLFGFDPEGGIPQDEVFYQRVHPEDRDRVRGEVFLERPEEGSDFDVVFRIVLPEGAIKYIRSTGHPVHNLSGDLVEYVGTSIDVTERMRVDEERERLRQAQLELAHVNRVTIMGELTASLAHEVNQPIAAAVTNANTCLRWLTRDHPDVEEARAAAMRIMKDGTRAAEIIGRIRQLFKKGTSQRELVDVNEIIQEMMVLLRGEITRYHILLRTDLAADLPQVMADRVQLQQVLMNLMINGIEAMKDTAGTRELAIRSQRTENEEVVVFVADCGVGLPPLQKELIFNAFFTTKPHGTGMGLRISRSIIESHGGRLWAADNSPRGASFCFSLPTKAEAPE
jgi:NO-binding membrane sensor protein with MHYT domain/signal transduction histidine kinase